MNMFLTYDMDLHNKQRPKKDDKSNQDDGGLKIERFFNRDQNFSISWYPSLKEYYNAYVYAFAVLI